MKRLHISNRPVVAGLSVIIGLLLVLTTFNYIVKDFHEGVGMVVLEFAGPLFLIGILGYVNYLVILEPFEDNQYKTILGWTVFTTVTSVAFVLIYLAHLSHEGYTLPPSEIIDAIIFGATAGAAGGGLASYSKARATQYSEKIRLQRDVFRLLNTALRHNILNGINIINGCTEQIRQRANGDVGQQVEIITNQSSSIQDLVENTKTISRFFSSEESRQVVNISEILAEEVETAKVTYPEVSFSTEIEAPVHVNGTPLIRSVFSNLIENAIEHNDADTRQVDVTLDHFDEDVEICVRDNGPGIPDSEKESVLQKETYSEEIGLYVVKSIVEELGGDIAVEDNEPRGTIFRLTIPKGNNRADSVPSPTPSPRELQVEK